VLTIRLAQATAVGARDHNEDDLRCGTADGFAYAVLSDGAGGHRGGAIASDIVVRCVAMRLQSARELTPQDLHDAVHEAHGLLMQRQRRASDPDAMHATLVALWIDTRRECALWSHVGDSRLYLLRDGRVHHVTRDDSVVQQLLDAGFITAEAAAAHPLKHHLACAMGVGADFDTHTLERPYALRPGDALLLCSDGWWDALSAADIEQTRLHSEQPQAWLDAMAERVAAAARPQQDNYSAVAVWVDVAHEKQNRSG
jgi:PPM family protein phosphatase